MADVLSQITIHLGPEAVQSVLDGTTLGATQRVEGGDPAVVEVTSREKSGYKLLLGQSW